MAKARHAVVVVSPGTDARDTAIRLKGLLDKLGAKGYAVAEVVQGFEGSVGELIPPMVIMERVQEEGEDDDDE